jgi:hypothetical protein
MMELGHEAGHSSSFIDTLHSTGFITFFQVPHARVSLCCCERKQSDYTHVIKCCFEFHVS